MVPANRLPGIVVERPPAPRTVAAAFWILVATCAIALATEVAGLVLIVRGGFSPDLSYFVAGLVAIGIRASLAFAARRGASFSRALLTLLAFISAFALFRAFDPLDIVLEVIMVAAVVLLWVRPSNRYFWAVVDAKAAAKGNEAPPR